MACADRMVLVVLGSSLVLDRKSSDIVLVVQEYAVLDLTLLLVAVDGLTVVAKAG
jgi:hypothetical protein